MFPLYDESVHFRATRVVRPYTIVESSFDARLKAIQAKMAPKAGRPVLSEAQRTYYKYKNHYMRLPKAQFSKLLPCMIESAFRLGCNLNECEARDVVNEILFKRQNKRMNVARENEFICDVDSGKFSVLGCEKDLFVKCAIEVYGVSENVARRVFNSRVRERVNRYACLPVERGCKNTVEAWYDDTIECVVIAPPKRCILCNKREDAQECECWVGNTTTWEPEEVPKWRRRSEFMSRLVRTCLVLFNVARKVKQWRDYHLHRRELFMIDVMNGIQKWRETVCDVPVIASEDIEQQPEVYAQMEMPAEGIDHSTTVTASNVGIEIESDEIQQMSSTVLQDWTSECTNDTIVRATNYTDRWFHVHDFVWSKGEQLKTVLLSLPADIYKSKDAVSSPNLLPFKGTTFTHFESMTVKFLVTSNKFQLGQLMAGFIYQDYCDNNFYYRTNKYALSQLPHVNIYPATMNEAELTIPFRHSLSMLYNQPSGRVNESFNLGKLVIVEVNPLSAGLQVAGAVNVSVQVKFNNVKLVGTRPINWPQMQMEAAAAMVATGAAMKLLNTVMPDVNRDNPPVNAESPYFVPTASHSWAAGTGRVEPTKLLRLDTRGQTTHPIETEDAFTISNLASKYGLISTTEVSINADRDSHILTMNVEPMFGKSVGTSSRSDVKEVYYFPPISVISSNFAYWRGSIKVKLDIVASQFHTCKLAYGFIPNVPDGQATPKRSEVSAGHTRIISVEGPKIIELEIPYVANQKWWPRTYTGNYTSVSAPAPSKFYMYMYNPPLRQDSAADKFFINIYVAAGSDFELAVPVQPSLGLAWNTYFDENRLDIYPVKPPVYGTNMGIVGFTVVDVRREDRTIPTIVNVTASGRMGDAITNYVNFTYPKSHRWDYKKENSTGTTNLKPNRILYIAELPSTNVPLYPYKDKDGKIEYMKDYSYGVVVPAYGNIFIIAKDKKSAWKLADAFQSWENPDHKTQVEPYLYSVPYKSNPDGVTWRWPIITGKENPFLEDMKKADWKLRVLSATHSSLDQVFSQAGDDNESSVTLLASSRSLNSSKYGFFDFGENFNDLLNLCRRYQQYGMIKLDKTVLDTGDKCTFYFTCNPIGLMDQASKTEFNDRDVFTRCREGPIPLLLSGYRYFRGSLRFRLVFPACSNTLIWIQHRPDRPSTPLALRICDKVSTADGLLNHGYATEIQLANINSIVEFEVPFYQYDAYGLLQCPPSESAGDAYDFQYGLGQIMVGLRCSEQDKAVFSDRYCEVFYALADDFSPSVFYGFPPTFLLDNMPEPDKLVTKKFNTLDMIDFPSDSSCSVSEDVPTDVCFQSDDAQTSASTSAPDPPKVVKKQEKKWYQLDFLSKAKDSVADAVKDGVREEVTPLIAKAQSEINNTLSKAKMDFSIKETLLLTFTNIAHCIANMSFESLAISVVSLFIGLGMLAMDVIGKGITIVKDIIIKIFCPIPKKKEESQDATQHNDNTAPKSTGPSDVAAQGPDDDESLIASWLSLLFGGISSVFAFKGASPFSGSRNVSQFFKDFSFSMRGAQGLYVFVKNSMQAIKHFFHYISARIDPHYRVLVNISEDKDIIGAWIKEVVFLNDPSTWHYMSVTEDYVDRVFVAYDYGQIYITHLTSEKVGHSLLNTINKLFYKLQDLRAKLINLGKNPHIRKEPFGIYIYGKAGVGKSQLREELCTAMLIANKDTLPTRDVFCVVNGSEKHWDQCNHQPVLVIDDIWNIQEGEMYYNQISMIYRLFSDVVLVPPKADLGSKGMRYNPNIVWMSSNYAAAPGNNINKDALNRRRHICIETVESETFVKDCPHCEDRNAPLDQHDPKWLSDYHHVNFYIHNLNFENKYIPSEHTRGKLITYLELKELLIEKYMLNRLHEGIRFERKLKRLQHIKGDFPVDAPSQFFLNTTEILNKPFAEQLQKYKEQQAKILQEMKDEYDKSWTMWALDSMKCENIKALFSKLLPEKMKTFYDKFKTDVKEAKDQAAKDAAIGNAILDNEIDPGVESQAPATSLAFENIEDVCFKGEVDLNLAHSFTLDALKTYLNNKDSVDTILKSKWFSHLKAEVQSKFVSEVFTRIRTKDQLIKLQLDTQDNTQCFFYMILSVKISKGIDYSNDLVKMCDNGVSLDADMMKWFAEMYRTNIFKQNINFKTFDTFLASIGSARCKHDFRYMRNMVLSKNELMLIGVSPNISDNVEHGNVGDCGTNSCPLKSAALRRHYLLQWYMYNPAIYREYKMGNSTAIPNGFEITDSVKIDDTWVTRAIFNLKSYWRNQLKPALKKIFTFIVDHIPMILLIMSILCTTVFVGTAVHDQRVVMRHQGIPFQGDWAYAQGAYSFTPVVGDKPTMGTAFMQSSQQSSAIVPIIAKNTFTIFLENTKTMKRITYKGLGIYDHYAIILRHYVDNIKFKFEDWGAENCILWMQYNPEYVTMARPRISLKLSDITDTCKYFRSVPSQYYNNDTLNAHKSNIVVWKLPARCLAFKNLLKYMPYQSELNNASREAHFVNEVGSQSLNIRAKSFKSSGLLIPERDGDAYHTAVCMQSYWEYGYQKFGACGSAIISDNLQNPLIGIHVAGSPSNNIGYAEVICRDMFQSLTLDHKAPKMVQQPKLKPVTIDDIQFQSAIYVHGRVEPADANRLPRKSKITPSLFHGEFPVTTAPNPLSPHDKRLPEPIDPIISGVEKHGLFVATFDENILNRCKEHLLNHLIAKVPPVLSSPRFLTLNEAICGSPDIPHVDPLNWQTSVGFPLKKEMPVGSSGKKWLFEFSKDINNHNIVTKLHPSLEQLLSLQNEMRKKHYQPFTVFTDCLKDTCIPIEKCSIPGKTRVFSISPVQYTIAFREKFGLFMASYRNVRISTFHAIGINVVSAEWAQLYNYISEVGEKFVTGDYSNFGPGLSLDVAKVAFDIIIDWTRHYIPNLTQEDLNSMYVLVYEMLNRYHLCNDLIYTPSAGLPSGSPITDIMNSIVNNLYLLYAWIVIVNKSLIEFDEHVRMVVYGDDVIMGVSDKYCEIFNSVTISKFFESLSIKFTDQSKSGELIKYRTIDTCTFLKCEFVPHISRPPLYFAKLDINSIHGCLNWNKGSLSKLEGTMVNARMAMELLYCHGPKVFNEYRKKIIDLCNLHRIEIVLPTWTMTI